MPTFLWTLRIGAVAFFVVACLHLFLGPQADVLLGAELPASAVIDPVLDSQNRFYGVAFSLYGVLLLLSASDLTRYAPVFYATMWVFFAGGLARLVSIYVAGLPSVFVMVLLVVELLLPPILHFWLKRVSDDV